jgi:hypothetical protein
MRAYVADVPAEPPVPTAKPDVVGVYVVKVGDTDDEFRLTDVRISPGAYG